MTKKPKPSISLIYTILANDQPVAAIKASGAEAREICREPWFKEELASLRSNGEPVLKPGVKLRVGLVLKTNCCATIKNSTRLKRGKISFSCI